MAATLSIELNTADAKSEVEKLLSKVEHKAPLMDRLAMYLETSTKNRFETGRGPDGKPWKPSRRALLQGGQTLLDHGHLRDSFVSASSESEAEVGSNHPGAAAHHFGAVIRPTKAKALRFQIPGVGWVMARKVTLPARPILGIDDADQKAMAEVITDYLADGAPA